MINFIFKDIIMLMVLFIKEVQLLHRRISFLKKNTSIDFKYFIFY